MSKLKLSEVSNVITKGTTDNFNLLIPQKELLLQLLVVHFWILELIL